MKKLICHLVFGALLCTAPASAQTVTYLDWRGKIKTIFFSGPGNFSFRVYPVDQPPLTGCSGGFLYMEVSHGNYQVYTASLITAAAGQRAVRLVYTVNANGFCQIQEGSVDFQPY